MERKLSLKNGFEPRHCDRWLWAMLLVALLGFLPMVWGQTSTTGILKGTITDPSGGAVPMAEVRVTNQGTNEERVVTSGAGGTYVVPLLPPGSYQLEVNAGGFARAMLTGVVLTVTETTVVNVPLSIGTTSTTIEVKGASTVVETSTNALGDVVSTAQVGSLPLVNRNFTQIMTLSAGVVAGVTQADELGRGSGGEVPEEEGKGENVNGARASDINFRMDGVDVNDYDADEFGVPIPNPDTIQEFKVQTGMYDAEYGRDAGANVNLVTKTGTNVFHGDLFEFWRNNVLNANDFFLNENGVARADLKQNQFGGTLGGPLVKNKLMFFGSYQGTRQINGVSGRQTFYSPLTTDNRSAASLGTLFAGQQGLQYIFGAPGFGPPIASDGSNINPVALNLLQMKLPNGQFLFPTANPATDLVSLSQSATFNENQYMGNFDYLQSSKSIIQGRFFTARSQTLNPFGYSGANLPGATSNRNQDFVVASLSDSYTFRPNLFNQLRLGYDRMQALTTPHSPFNYSDIGVTSSAQNNDKPSVVIAGSDNFNAGIYAPMVQNLFNLEDTLAWVHGRHSFRFGGGVTRSFLINSGEEYYGQVNFPSWSDFLLGMNGAQNGTAGIPVFPPDGFSNVLYSLQLLGVLAGHNRTWEVPAYVQDDFRATSKLTLNLGLRWEWLPPFTNTSGRATNLNPALINPNPPAGGTLAGFVVPANWSYPIPAGVVKSNVNGFVPGSGNDTWGPRLGLAYSLLPNSDRVVLRTGYGLYYSAIAGNTQFQSVPGFPWADISVFFPPNNGAASFAHPFQEPIPPLSAFPFFEPYSPGSDLQPIATQQTLRPAITQQYTFNIQTEITPTLALQVGYVGSSSSHLMYSHCINQAGLATATNPIRGETASTLSNLSLRVPYEGFDAAQFLEQTSSGLSSFNALEVTLKKNLSHGLQFIAAYTYSKTLATGAPTIVGSSFGGGTIGDQNNLYSAYGPANFSRPNRLIFSPIYEFPNLHHGPAYARKLMNGWAASAVMTLQSGTPLSFLNTNANNLYGTQSDFANIDVSGCGGSLKVPGAVNARLNEYFNTSCFTPPPVISSDGGTGFGNGNAWSGALRGPSQHNVDLSLRKTTAISERMNVEFRAEFFNVFNSTQFANPDTAYSDGAPAFGQITATTVAARIGQLALKFNF